MTVSFFSLLPKLNDVKYIKAKSIDFFIFFLFKKRRIWNKKKEKKKKLRILVSYFLGECTQHIWSTRWKVQK